MIEPALRLNQPTQSLDLSVPIPYQATINYTNGDSINFAASLDSEGRAVITPQSSRWITCNGAPIFSADKQLLELS